MYSNNRCNRDTKVDCKTIKACKVDYVLSVKENRLNLYNDIALFFSTESKRCDYAKTVEKSHGQIERRRRYTTTDIEWLEGRIESAGIPGIGIIEIKRKII